MRDARAEQRELIARRHAHAASMVSAYQAFHDGSHKLAADLLEEQKPAQGQPDVRRIEWHLLWNLCHAERLVFREHERGVNGGPMAASR